MSVGFGATKGTDGLLRSFQQRGGSETVQAGRGRKGNCEKMWTVDNTNLRSLAESERGGEVAGGRLESLVGLRSVSFQINES